jgi:uncharacterized protein YcfL
MIRVAVVVLMTAFLLAGCGGKSETAVTDTAVTETVAPTEPVDSTPGESASASDTSTEGGTGQN